VHLILASNSPRRRKLLSLSGWSFSTLPAEVDETPRPGESPLAYVLRLAESKARRAAENAGPETLVLAADTTVVDEVEREGERTEEILGKPVDPDEAESMLRRLRGRSHRVYTGLAALKTFDSRVLSDWCLTRVSMRNYSDKEMLAYVASGDPLDKAGAYAIQNPSFHPVEELHGCYANVIGLPVCHVTRLLENFGLPPTAGVALACRSPLPHVCQIPKEIVEAQ
jgi:MAF protein